MTTMIATITVRHSHGLTETFSTLDDAMRALEDIYGDEIVTAIYDGGDLTDVDDLRHGRALVWSDEASSVDDDGARAVASVSVSWAD